MLTNPVYPQHVVRNYLGRRKANRELRPIAEAFARRHPAWSAALFDEHFFKGPLSRLLMRAAENHDHLDPRRIADEWADQITLSPEGRRAYMDELSAILKEFLADLEGDLFQGTHDG